ncbi:MAG TPA: efflux RND transporter permease subunit, partial [Xanthobacteraceae bacterium]|nr:efflux RND transporter permease subunit [Xanthobacteraceae bacterium]
SHAADYQPLVVAWRNGAAVRLSDVADVQDSVENLRNAGLANGKPAVLVILFRQPGANIIDTVDGVKSELPRLRAEMPAAINVDVAADRTTTIRASLHDTELTLVIAIGLVMLVVVIFLRDLRAALVTSVAAPTSIIGTFAAMYLLGYSLDNLSLMALTISTGFVVDDAIVVLENITRHIEDGRPRLEAALRGAGEVAFTVLSISASLVAIFLPILLMGGILGRLFREFAITLSLAITISLFISLTTTPMMCALFLRPRRQDGRPRRRSLFDRVLAGYEHSLAWALRHGGIVMLVLLVVVGLNVLLFAVVPKGFFPQQDTGRLIGTIQADQSISFQMMQQKLAQMMAIMQNDPAVESVVGYTGAGSGGGQSQTNTGTAFISLKPLAERSDNVDAVIARLRRKLAQVPGSRLYRQAVQDIRVGGRQANAQYQYTLQADDPSELYAWAPKLLDALEHSSVLADVSSDQQLKGLATDIVIDRDTAGRFGLTASQIDNTLYDAFGQRQVTVIYSANNQYHVVMEVAPRYWQDPATLRDLYVSTAGAPPSATQTTNAVVGTVAAGTAAPSANAAAAATTASPAGSNAARNAATNAIGNSGSVGTSSGAAVSTNVGTMIPLAAFAHFGSSNTLLGVSHQGLFVATTISFNLHQGASLGEAAADIQRAISEIHMPPSIRGTLQGTARVFEESLA